MLNLLRLLDNRRQDIPLLSVLRSPIGGFSTEELIRLRAGGQDRPCLDSLLSAAQDDTPLGHKAAGFLARLSLWQEQAALLSLPVLIARLLEDTGFARYVRALPGGAARQGNLTALLERSNGPKMARASAPSSGSWTGPRTRTGWGPPRWAARTWCG